MNASFEPKSQEQGRHAPRKDNQGALTLPSQTFVQAKLEMTDPGDHDEQEADAVADEVLGGGRIARKISGGGGSSGIAVPRQMESRLLQLQGTGQPMPQDLRNMMEGAFGREFPQVRLHTDSEAAGLSASLQAKAFTHGDDIYFNQGQFQPQSPAGRHLIAHELTHTVQQSGRISRAPLPEAPNRIKVTGRGSDPLGRSEEQILQDSILGQIDINRFTRHQAVIRKGDAQGIGIIDSVLDDCDELVALADDLKSGKRSSSPDPRLIYQNKQDLLVRQLVQQLYNTLSQVSLAMDIVKKPKITGNDLGALAKTPWVKCRNKFNSVVKKVATLAHNPAIAVLIYEGTYYPTQYSSKTLKATRKAVGDTKKGEIETADLLFYGAVCNNAAYGSVFAAGTEYQSQSGDAARPVLGLSRGDRAPWREYDLQGTGVGKDALDQAKQGDIMIFWHFSKLDDAAIAGREKQHHRDIKKELTVSQENLEEAKKAAEKGSDDTWELLGLYANAVGLASEVVRHQEADTEITELFKQLREAKSEYENSGKALKKAARSKGKAEAAVKSAHDAHRKAKSELDKAIARFRNATTEKGKTAAEKDLDKRINALVAAIGKKKEAESSLSAITSQYDSESSSYDSLKDRYSDLIVAADMNAQHTEVIVGVDDAEKMYLLSGAHGSNFVNGVAREKGKLAWKSAEEIRNGRIMRRIPMNNESDFIAVNIPSVMEKQGYDVSKVTQKHKEQDEGKSEGDLVSEFAQGSYETKTGNVPVYFNSNTAESITIQWIGKYGFFIR